MTTSLAANADHALAALALIDAVERVNPTNQKALLASIDPVDLIAGLLLVAAGFRSGMAAACCMSVEDLDENTRTMYLAAADGII